jgi:hypothetical protein
MNKTIAIALATITAITVTNSNFAQGFTLTNKDSTSYEVEIIEDNAPDTPRLFQLEQGQVIDQLCADGCTVWIDGQEYIFFGNEELAIEEGELVDQIIE